MTGLPRRPTGLRADQLDEWEGVAADQFGAPNEPDRGPVDPGWIEEATRAIDAARAYRADR